MPARTSPTEGNTYEALQATVVAHYGPNPQTRAQQFHSWSPDATAPVWPQVATLMRAADTQLVNDGRQAKVEEGEPGDTTPLLDSSGGIAQATAPASTPRESGMPEVLHLHHLVRRFIGRGDKR